MQMHFAFLQQPKKVTSTILSPASEVTRVTLFIAQCMFHRGGVISQLIPS